LEFDTLQHIFNKVTEACLLSPLRDRAARIRLSLYADDATVFLNAARQEVDLVMVIMQHFGEATSLCINVSKSSVVPIRCAGIDLDSVLQNISGGRVPFPITYLGLPVTLGQLRMSHLQPVLDKATTKLAGWQGQ
jgi:hypothetical protein